MDNAQLVMSLATAFPHKPSEVNAQRVNDITANMATIVEPEAKRKQKLEQLANARVAAQEAKASGVPKYERKKTTKSKAT